MTHISSSPESEAIRAVHLVKIDGFNQSTNMQYVKFTWNVDGYDWEVRLHLSYPGTSANTRFVVLKLIFLGEARGIDVVRANLSCRLVDPSGALQPSAEKIIIPSTLFHRPSDPSEIFQFMSRDQVMSSGFLKGDSLTMECAVQVFRDLKAIPVPSSNLPHHFGELLESQLGVDVEFVVSGESFPAHKSVLAVRSPVFKAQFFGEMAEKTSGRVEIEEMDPSVFGAMLCFIYTDAVPELDKKMVAAATTSTMAQHLLVAADRYGLDRLKVMCECRLAYAIDVSNVASTLVLAEKHGCSQLKTRCIEFIAGGSHENLDAVLETQGFKDLEAGIPSLVTELLKAAHGRKN